jgi:hypothetical protein
MDSRATSTASPSPSKGKVFARRLFGTVILWGVVLGALFSGSRVLSDVVFVAVMTLLAVVGLIAGRASQACRRRRSKISFIARTSS